MFDLAIIELLDESVKSALLNNWGSVPASQISEASLDGTFFVFGYPSEKLHQVDKTLMCSLITACTKRLSEPPTNASGVVDPNIDLFFLHDEVAEDEDGVQISSPHLRGVSGGGIWEILDAKPGELWTAEKNMRLVGIQSSTIHGEWLRAKSAQLLLSELL